MWGDDPARRRGSPLLDAFERGPGHLPRSRSHSGQPTLIPSSPDLSSSRVPSDLVADCLQSWAELLAPQVIVVDTHPGANDLTEGALLAADLVAVPVRLGVRELDALEAMLSEYAAYRLAIVPTMVPAVPTARLVERLSALASGSGVPVVGMISEHRWLCRRLRRRAVVCEPTPGRQVARAADEFRNVANELLGLASRYMGSAA